MPCVVWFRVDLTCVRCGAVTPAHDSEVYTSGLSRDPIDTNLGIGGTLEIDLDDLAEGYAAQRLPDAASAVVVAVERWGCRACKTAQWVRLELERVARERYRLRDARASEMLDDAHFVSRKPGS